jgi:predicted O-methyltransferase YrrM
MQRFGALDQRLRARFARGNGDLRLPKPVRSAILPSKAPGIRRMSDKAGGQVGGGPMTSPSRMMPVAEKLRRFAQKSPVDKRAAIWATLAGPLPLRRRVRRMLGYVRAFQRRVRYAQLSSKAEQISSGLGDSAAVLYGLVRSMKPEVCVEIGSARGKSACYIGMALKENGRGKLYAIDPHEPTDWNDNESVNSIEIFMKNISELGLSKQVTLVRSYSEDAARDWKRPIDLIFIDGDHSYEGVRRDWELFVPYVKAFGVVVFHDTIWDLPPYRDQALTTMGVPRFVDELRQQGYQVLTIDQDYGLSLVQPVVGGRSLQVPSPVSETTGG